MTNSPFWIKDFFEKTSEKLQLRVTQNSKGTTLQHVWVRFNNAVFICASFFQFRRFHQKTFEPFCLWKCNLYLQSSHVSVSDFPFCVEISFRAEQRYALSSPSDCAGSSFSPVIEAHRRTRVWWIPACAQAEVKAVRLVLIVAHVGRSLSLGWSKETPTCNPRLMKSFMSCCMAVMYTNALKQTRSTQTFQLRYIGGKKWLEKKIVSSFSPNVSVLFVKTKGLNKRRPSRKKWWQFVNV